MKKLFIILLLFFAAKVSHAQHKTIDTLKLKLVKANTDTEKYVFLRSLSAQYQIFLPDSAIILGQQAYLLAKKNNWLHNQAVILNNIANAYASLGDYVKSMQFYFRSLRLYESLNELNGEAIEYNNIGSTDIQKEDFKNALPYLRSSQKQLNIYARSHKLVFRDKQLRVYINQNIGECYLDMHKIDSAEYYLNISYDDCNKLKLPEEIGPIERDLGEVQASRAKKDEALKLFNDAVLNAKSIDDVENLSIAYLSIANLYHKFKQQDSAEYYAQKALEIAIAGKYEQDVLNAGKVLYAFYDEDHNVQQAYKYFKITTAAKDSLFSQDKVKQLVSLAFDEKQRQQEIEAAQIEAQGKIRTYVLLAGLTILLLLVIIFWRNSKQRKTANKLLQSQKEDIEAALNKLQLTQTQLIQSEKMASLGELTAGIAHEIQNPLNFVNNFSEVNKDLLTEMKEEIDKGNLDEVKAIANNIIDNEEKINHHGKRADFIVKGMLQHSRMSTGERQLTNINILADEFLKLSYHGLRAKHKSFNAEMVTHFDASLPLVKVVQQDMGRIMLNLFNNAFYAVNQKQKTASNGYKPEVTVTTARENGSVIIKVRDNGVGIPDAIKEKIMQPFFTTKPTGEGTGLGLSLTYDMVIKGHGGSINIESEEGKFTEFIVVIPV